jgi:signal transduction histidine kinase
MLSPENRLFCQIDNTPSSAQEQQRLATLADLGLLEAESVPIFEEATQTAAHFLDAPICILGLIDGDRQWFKSAIGLSRIGLMNDLASSRQLPRQESFCTHVVDSRQVLIINDAKMQPAFCNSLLTQRYGIRAYLGVPLMASNGCCLGTLAIMDLNPREFTAKQVELLELTARWCMSEFERNRLLKQQSIGHQASPVLRHPTPINEQPAASSVKVNLITQMTQELRTPLTSILGMASVLNREIYGPLTDKQKEYMDIVHNSGQYLLSLVNEILELGALDATSCHLNLSPVDVEMLCQQALGSLSQAAQRREQQLRLTVEPGPRIWLLDKDKVRQMLYHLAFSVIQSSTADSTIRIHVSRKRHQLNMLVWTSHPWLGEGLPQAMLTKQLLQSTTIASSEIGMVAAGLSEESRSTYTDSEPMRLSTGSLGTSGWESSQETDDSKLENCRQSLALMLSRQLAEMHGGNIGLQGSAESGYRYVITLPQVTEVEESL